ncbi:MAG: chloride channel protein [Ilumatobacteraceae bacterium]
MEIRFVATPRTPDATYRRRAVWLASLVGGALTGLVSWAFLRALDWANDTRVEHGRLVLLLPVAGAVVAGAYHYWGGRAKGGTPAVIEQANVLTHGVPTRMAPFIFGGATIGHLAGASVGREGAALQMAASVTDTTGRALRLHPEERRIAIAASLAGGWGAVFGVPITGIVFCRQVNRHRRWRSLVPSVISAVTGLLVVRGLGYRFEHPTLAAPDWTFALPWKLILLGIGVGLVARLFVAMLKGVRHHAARHLHQPMLRAAVGGAATLALLTLVGRDHLGLSSELLTRALEGGEVDWFDPLLKMTFTAIALGTGFVGGEVLPLFVMGATLGGSWASGLNADRMLFATTASTAAFASAASVMTTGIVLTVEQFGWHSFVPAVIVGMTARLVAGRPGLYVAHH